MTREQFFSLRNTDTVIRHKHSGIKYVVVHKPWYWSNFMIKKADSHHINWGVDPENYELVEIEPVKQIEWV